MYTKKTGTVVKYCCLNWWKQEAADNLLSIRASAQNGHWPMHHILRDQTNVFWENISNSPRYQCYPVDWLSAQCFAVEASSSQRRWREHGENFCSTLSHYRKRGIKRTTAILTSSGITYINIPNQTVVIGFTALLDAVFLGVLRPEKRDEGRARS